MVGQAVEPDADHHQNRPRRITVKRRGCKQVQGRCDMDQSRSGLPYPSRMKQMATKVLIAPAMT